MRPSPHCSDGWSEAYARPALRRVPVRRPIHLRADAAPEQRGRGRTGSRPPRRALLPVTLTLHSRRPDMGHGDDGQILHLIPQVAHSQARLGISP